MRFFATAHQRDVWFRRVYWILALFYVIMASLSLGHWSMYVWLAAIGLCVIGIFSICRDIGMENKWKEQIISDSLSTKRGRQIFAEHLVRPSKPKAEERDPVMAKE